MPLRVAVVGAGPCGSLVGRLLAKRGHEVFLLEEHVEIGKPRHCTGLVSRDVPSYYGISEKKAHILEEFSEAELIYGDRSLVLKLEPNAVALEREGFEYRAGKHGDRSRGSNQAGRKGNAGSRRL